MMFTLRRRHRFYSLPVEKFASVVGKRPERITDIDAFGDAGIAAEGRAHARLQRLGAMLKDERRSRKEARKKDCFSSFPLDSRVVEALRRNNLLYPTAVQSGLLKEWFAHKNDVLVKAQTGTGKSLGYISLLYNEFIVRKMSKEVGCGQLAPENIIIVPNAILAEQLVRWTRLLLAPELEHKLDQVCRFAEEPIEPLATKVWPQCHTLIGTGRVLLRLFSQDQLKTECLKCVVVDEADAVLKPLKKYATETERKNRSRHPVPAQLLLEQFCHVKQGGAIRKIYASATLNALLKSHLKKGKLVGEGAVLVEAGDHLGTGTMESRWECPGSISHHHHLLSEGMEKTEAVAGMISMICGKEDGKQGLIIVPDCFKKASLLAELQSYGHVPVLLHEQRGTTNGNLLIGSEADIRGLDMPDLHFVVIVGLLDSVGAYIHAAGRVGRMGTPGRAYTILGSENDLYRHLAGLSSLLHITSLPIIHS